MKCAPAGPERSPVGEETRMSINAESAARHWEKTRNLTILVLIVWGILAIIVPWFAKDLNSMSFLGCYVRAGAFLRDARGPYRS